MSDKNDDLDFGGLSFPNDDSNKKEIDTSSAIIPAAQAPRAPRAPRAPMVPAGEKPSNEMSPVDAALSELEASAPKNNKPTSIEEILADNKLTFGDEKAGDTIAVNSIKSEISTDVKSFDEKDEQEILEAANAKKKRIIKRVVIGLICGILGIVIGVIGFLAWYKHYLYSQMEVIEAPVTIQDENGNIVFISDLTEATEHEIIESDDIHNFLLIGIDSRSSGIDSWGNSDVNMVMSVNNTEGTIRMISIARDSYAYVPGYSNPMKINAAMAYGGPELLKATIENTLRITIDGYAFVNFYNMAGVIDAVGGVYVYATQSEVYAEHGLNWNLAELNNLQNLDPSYQAVTSTGDIWLNGRQAVAYARIRYVGNGDYERSERQVEVLRSLLNQFMAMSMTGKASAIDDVLGLIATNISEDEVTTYAFEFLPSMDNMTIEYMQLPIEGCFNSGMYGNEWSIRPNWNAMIPFVHEFFYGEQVEFDPVRDIPSSPALENCTTLDDITVEELLR